MTSNTAPERIFTRGRSDEVHDGLWFSSEGGAFSVEYVRADLHRKKLRDYFAGQALGNSTICTGKATGYELRNWFGGRSDITRHEIAAKQASEYADAMMADREKKGE